jgi:circadian clock protein KaiB
MYIIGDNRRSALAVENLQDICNNYLHKDFCIDIFDIKENPELMAENKIAVAPTVIKRRPLPEKFFIGDMSDTDSVLMGLGLRPTEKKPSNNCKYEDGFSNRGIRPGSKSKLRY